MHCCVGTGCAGGGHLTCGLPGLPVRDMCTVVPTGGGEKEMYGKVGILKVRHVST